MNEHERAYGLIIMLQGDEKQSKVNWKSESSTGSLAVHQKISAYEAIRPHLPSFISFASSTSHPSKSI